MALSQETQQICRELLKYFLVPLEIKKATKEITRVNSEITRRILNYCRNFY